MKGRTILLAALLAVSLIASAVFATFWILSQPVPDTVGTDSLDQAAAASLPHPGDDDASPSEGRIQVKLYVLASSGQELATVNEVIPLETSLQLQAKRVVALLLERSQTIPRGVVLRELFITSQGVAYLDLSREVVANHPGGSSAEELTVFSLTNTLVANFPAVKMVKILVEGREVQTLAGHLDLTVPYGRAPRYLQPESERQETQNEAG
ncbi:MAG TPA: GerMN domain-containing protein [Vicinamibacteria bacterium]|nr:GerMN domain-containing protein [Vicinamibacteria bacterium]